MTKKAQAAMEFLMTYGWAILVVLAAIGALAYFGVLSPDNLLPERCTGPPGLDCTEKAMLWTSSSGFFSTSHGSITDFIMLSSKNNLGQDITLNQNNLITFPIPGPNYESNCGDPGVNTEFFIAFDGANSGITDGELIIDERPSPNNDFRRLGGFGGDLIIKNGQEFLLGYHCENIADGRFSQDIIMVYESENGLQQKAVYNIRGRAS